MSKHSGRRTIYVYADWDGLEGPHLTGTMHSELLRGKEVFSFEHDYPLACRRLVETTVSK